MMSESNKQQAVNKLTEIVANFTAMISTRMPDDVVDKLKQLKDAETSSMGKIIYHTMFDNMQKAIDLNRPACQDTGEIMFFVKVGSRFPLLGELQSILKQAVEEATVKAPLRHNAVEIFDEVNTGKNTDSAETPARRHPKVGSDVTIYAGATLLGGATEVGDNVVIGGNAFVTSSVPPHTRVSMKSPELTFREMNRTVWEKA